jgi:hypothetical protein
MSTRSKFAIAATSLAAFMHRADGLFTEALRRIYASHVERAQMRLAPIRLPQNRTSLHRDRSRPGAF